MTHQLGLETHFPLTFIAFFYTFGIKEEMF